MSHRGCPSTRGTSEEGFLARQVLKECQRNQELLSILQAHREKDQKETPIRTTRSKKKTRLQDTSSSSPGSTPAKKSKAKKRRKSRKTYKNNSSSSFESSSSSDYTYSPSPTKSSKWSTIVNNTTLSKDGNNQASANDTWYLGNAYDAEKVSGARLRHKAFIFLPFVRLGGCHRLRAGF